MLLYFEAGGRRELETLATLSKQRANSALTQAIVAGRDRDDWGNTEDLRRIQAARGGDVEILESDEPSAEWGWRTGIDVAKGRLTSLEEAREEWKKTKDLRQPSVLPSDEDEGRNQNNDEPNYEPDDEQDEDQVSEDDIGAADDSGGLVIPAAGWGLKNRWRDPRLFEGVAAECLNTADLMAYVQTMGFSTSSSTCTREQYLKIIVDGLKGLKQSEGYRLRERRTKRKASPDQSETSKSQRPRMDTNTGSKGRTISDADLDVQGSDHEDCEDEEVAEDEESSVVSEGVNWSLETPAYKIAVDCPIVAAMQDVQRADNHLPEDIPNLFWNWLWF